MDNDFNNRLLFLLLKIYNFDILKILDSPHYQEYDEYRDFEKIAMHGYEKQKDSDDPTDLIYDILNDYISDSFHQEIITNNNYLDIVVLPEKYDYKVLEILNNNKGYQDLLIGAGIFLTKNSDNLYRMVWNYQDWLKAMIFDSIYDEYIVSQIGCYGDSDRGIEWPFHGASEYLRQKIFLFWISEDKDETEKRQWKRRVKIHEEFQRQMESIRENNFKRKTGF